MPIQPLSNSEILALVGTTEAGVGFTYPAIGTQPYYDWLMETLNLLARSSVPDYRVSPDAAGPMRVFVAPGRASIGGVGLVFTGETIDLSTYNNDTVYLWLEDQSSVATIGVATDAAGWPGGAHLKLAEVTLAAGTVTQILDRRLETVLKV